MVDSVTNTLALTGSTSTNTTSSAGQNGAMLDQQDFLTLLTAQLQNQDPLAPMENGEFLAQMAQFSTVSGIQQVNDTLSSMTSSVRDVRMATAAELLGHQVLVPGNVARPDDAGSVHGVLELPDDAEAVILTYADATSGEILHSETLADQSEGLVGFSWQDIPQSVIEKGSGIRISASMVGADGNVSEVAPSVYARVLSARAGTTADDITLTIQDYGALNALEIESFR